MHRGVHRARLQAHLLCCLDPVHSIILDIVLIVAVSAHWWCLAFGLALLLPTHLGAVGSDLFVQCWREAAEPGGIGHEDAANIIGLRGPSGGVWQEGRRGSNGEWMD